MILVDDAVWPWRGKKWCHLVSDTSEEELHAFAKKLGLQRNWYQQYSKYPAHRHMPHYDITDKKRIRALELGAVAVPSIELVERALWISTN